MRMRILLGLLLLAAANGLAQDSKLQFADLGTCKLESGRSITGCRLGYRTYGKVNADRSNVVVLTTWFLGTADGVANAFVGRDKAIDPAQYFVIAIDALADGVSSSPSNSKTQPRMNFPVVTIRDMVETQHRLLTEKFHLSHIRAVAGFSMGGMQAFQWAYSYPGFMDRIVPVFGSPRLSSYDLLLWQSELDAIKSDAQWKGGNYAGKPLMKAAFDIHKLHLQTPARMVREISSTAFPKDLEAAQKEFHFDPNDHIRQLQAMMALDVVPGKTIAQMAQTLKPKALIIVAKQDLMVNPTNAVELAKAAGAKLIELDSDCGHLAFGCESAKLTPMVKEFLAK